MFKRLKCIEKHLEDISNKLELVLLAAQISPENRTSIKIKDEDFAPLQDKLDNHSVPGPEAKDEARNLFT